MMDQGVMEDVLHIFAADIRNMFYSSKVIVSATRKSEQGSSVIET